MPENELELIFASSNAKSCQMHDLMEAAAVPFLNQLLDATNGQPLPQQIFVLWAWAASLVSVIFYRFELATPEDVQRFTYDEGSVLIFQIMGIGRNQELSEKQKVSLFEELNQKFAYTAEQIDTYSNLALDYALESKSPKDAVVDFATTSPLHSDSYYGVHSAMSKDRFQLLLTGLVYELFNLTIDEISKFKK